MKSYTYFSTYVDGDRRADVIKNSDGVFGIEMIERVYGKGPFDPPQIKPKLKKKPKNPNRIKPKTKPKKKSKKVSNEAELDMVIRRLKLGD